MKRFKTLQGFFGKEEPDEEIFIHFSVSLRIWGSGLNHQQVSKTLSISPTHQHTTGQIHGKAKWSDDMWSFTVDVHKEEKPETHLNQMYDLLSPHFTYLKALKAHFNIEIFCTYTSNSDNAGFEIPALSLRLFRKLEVPLSVSVNIC